MGGSIEEALDSKAAFKAAAAALHEAKTMAAKLGKQNRERGKQRERERRSSLKAEAAHAALEAKARRKSVSSMKTSVEASGPTAFLVAATAARHEAQTSGQLPNDLAAIGFGTVKLTAATGRHFALVATKPADAAAAASSSSPAIVEDLRAEFAKADTHLKTWESKKSKPDGA